MVVDISSFDIRNKPLLIVVIWRTYWARYFDTSIPVLSRLYIRHPSLPRNTLLARQEGGGGGGGESGEGENRGFVEKNAFSRDALKIIGLTTVQEGGEIKICFLQTKRENKNSRTTVEENEKTQATQVTQVTQATQVTKRRFRVIWRQKKERGNKQPWTSLSPSPPERGT